MDTFFKELRITLDNPKTVKANNGPRAYIHVVESIYNKHKSQLPAKMRKFVELGILMKPQYTKSREYRATKAYESLRNEWLIRIHNKECPECGNRVKGQHMVAPSEFTFCSTFCAQRSEDTKSRIKGTIKKKYGVSSIMEVPHIRDKVTATMNKRYGGHTLASKVLSQKVRKTLLKNHGVTNPMKSQEIVKKVASTLNERWGGIGTASPITGKKIRNSLKRNLGVSSPFESEEVRSRARESLVARYGVDNALKSTEIRESMRRNHTEKYGCDHPMKRPEVKSKIRETSLKRYGEEHHMRNPEQFQKWAKSSFTIREVRIKGKKFRVQGAYEEYVLRYLVKKFGKDAVVTQFDKRYPKNTFQKLRTFPDFYISSLGFFVECKSTWTLLGSENLESWSSTVFKKNRDKARTAESSGYRVAWVVANPGQDKLVELPPEWYRMNVKRVRKFLREASIL